MSSAFVHRFIIIIGERAMQSVCKAQPSPEASITDSVSFGDRTHRPSRRCSSCRVRAAMSTSPTTQSSGYRGRRKTYPILSSPIDGLQTPNDSAVYRGRGGARPRKSRVEQKKTTPPVDGGPVFLLPLGGPPRHAPIHVRVGPP